MGALSLPVEFEGQKKKRRRDSGDDDDLLGKELVRQRSVLNEAFRKWVIQCKEVSMFSSWELGCRDYISHLRGLNRMFETRGDVAVCGTGDMGQLGLGIGDDSLTMKYRPSELASFDGERVIAAACGGMHNIVSTVSKDKNYSVWTWGVGDDGSLGRSGDEAIPARVPGLSRVVITSVCAGDSHCLALSISAQVFYWGRYRDHDGKGWILGNDGKSSFGGTQKDPVIVPCAAFEENGGVVEISSGTNHSLALCGNGSVFSWGIQECGQLGRPTCSIKKDPDSGKIDTDLVRKQHLEPKLMTYLDGSPVTDARSIAAGNHHSFVIQAKNSRVFGCGLNQYGQLALDPEEHNQVQLLHSISGLDKVGVEILCAGEHHSVALSQDGKVYTFGRADSCELGVKPLNGGKRKPGDFESTPQLVTFPGQNITIDRIFSGDHHSGAVSKDGSLYMWGFGESAQLGLGKKGNEMVPSDCEEPALVPKSKFGDRLEVVSAYGGAQHTLILTK